MKTAIQILNEHLLPATAPNIHALEEYASGQCRQRDELIKAQDELIAMYLYPAKATLWKDIPDNIEASIELLNKIGQLKNELNEKRSKA